MRSDRGIIIQKRQIQKERAKMINTDLTKLAMKVAYEAHKTQVDKAGIPYIFHSIHVAEQMDDEYSTCVALLHDTIEDTDISPETLREYGFPERVINALELLTHDKQIPYPEYIKKIKIDPIATKVKIADIKHNSDLTRLDTVDEAAMKRLEKYKQALGILLNQ